jgi:hypothetical protein
VSARTRAHTPFFGNFPARNGRALKNNTITSLV